MVEIIVDIGSGLAFFVEYLCDRLISFSAQNRACFGRQGFCAFNRKWSRQFVFLCLQNKY